ncbi:integral membrane protein [Tothia fuscella]|uniref:Integral membrane protein n=1 Tax=Tothia fuscella TaxID=1048955 RepID=A0A9P4TUY4_9PEZI|nr:integral membrane protein [Tothia fuscella]
MTSRTSTSLELEPVPAYPESAVFPKADESQEVLAPDLARIQSHLTNASILGDEVSKGRTAVVISSVTVITGISSLLAGLIVVALPTIAKDLQIPSSLLLCPASIFSLTCGCTLLLSGSVADVVGPRYMYLLGSFLQSVFTLACGLSRTTGQLIIFRGLAGVASSLCLPSAVSIITTTFAEGKRRNISFAAMGGGQPVGFAIGLALGGVFADSIGWKWGFYIASILNTIVLLIAVWGLPKNEGVHAIPSWNRLVVEIDWVGAVCISVSLAMLSYILAALTGNTSDIHEPRIIALLATGLALIPAFILWVGRQERLGRPALIPNSLWRNTVFTSICVNVFLTWGAFNALENLLTFVFQYVQNTTAIQASLRFLPAPVVGSLVNILMGLVVHRVRADVFVTATTAISAISPLLLALMDPKASYWAYSFPAIALNAIGADTLFTVSNLVITSSFPSKTQALAGGVFNTVAQVGKSVGLAISAVIASTITMRSNITEKESAEALVAGYKAAFWYCFAGCVATLLSSAWGLRGIGKVGLKRD